MREKYIISIAYAGRCHDMEFVGTLEEVKKEADKVARLLFSPEDQVAVSREGETIYFGRP